MSQSKSRRRKDRRLKRSHRPSEVPLSGLHKQSFTERHRWAIVTFCVATVIGLAGLALQVYTERRNIPALEFDIRRISFYDTTQMTADSLPSSPSTIQYNPWVGAQLLITNNGRQSVTLINLQFEVDYLPLKKRGIGAGFLLVDETRDGLDFYRQPTIDLPAGESRLLRIIMPVILRLTSIERAEYKRLLRTDAVTDSLYTTFRVMARDGANRSYTSYNYFEESVPLCVPARLPGQAMVCFLAEPTTLQEKREGKHEYWRVTGIDVLLPAGIDEFD